MGHVPGGRFREDGPGTAGDLTVHHEHIQHEDRQEAGGHSGDYDGGNLVDR